MMQFLFWERNLSLNLLDLNCLNGQIWKRETFHCQNLLVSIYTKYANWKQACNTNISTCQNILPCCYFSTSPNPERVDHASTLAGCLTKLKRCHFHNYSFPWQPFFDDDNFRNGYWEIRQGVNYWTPTLLFCIVSITSSHCNFISIWTILHFQNPCYFRAVKWNMSRFLNPSSTLPFGILSRANFKFQPYW